MGQTSRNNHVASASTYNWYTVPAGTNNVLLNGTLATQAIPLVTNTPSITVQAPAIDVNQRFGLEYVVKANRAGGCAGSLATTKQGWVGRPDQPLSLNTSVADLCLQEIRPLSINPVGGASTYAWDSNDAGIYLQPTATVNSFITGETLGDFSFTITGNNICGNNNNTYAVTVIDCSGDCGVYPLPPCGPMMMATFPNPVQDQLSISLSDEYVATATKLDLRIELLDAFGFKKRDIVSTRQNSIINTHDLPKGLYYLKISFPKGSITRQIAKE